ncbi:MAG: hypothetical protein JNJ84_15295, partial [Rhodobacteraceae bacterium]|nr:hypothetical protein [Paracoccaceae bacterium]
MEDGSTGQEAAAGPPQAAAEAPAPMPRRHRRRRGTGLAGRLVLLTLALLV